MTPQDTAPVTTPPEAGAETGGEGYRVQLPTFEGPLDLLLHLIQEHEVDIMDIPVGFIAERYVAYVTLMQELNIDLASEYLVMAATLTHIKSRMLLPTPPEDQEDPESELEIDPRAELVRRLLEYQKYKNAAEQLAERSIQGRDVFGRGAPAPTVEGPAPLAPISLFKLLDAFQSVLERTSKTIGHEIEFDRLSITERINELCDLLRGKERWLFHELFEGQRTRAEVIITFLALLEMTRLRLTRLVQEGPLEPIEVLPTLGDEGSAKEGSAAPPALEGGTSSQQSDGSALLVEPRPDPELGLLEAGAVSEPELGLLEAGAVSEPELGVPEAGAVSEPYPNLGEQAEPSEPLVPEDTGGAPAPSDAVESARELVTSPDGGDPAARRDGEPEPSALGAPDVQVEPSAEPPSPQIHPGGDEIAAPNETSAHSEPVGPPTESSEEALVPSDDAANAAAIAEEPNGDSGAPEDELGEPPRSDEVSDPNERRVEGEPDGTDAQRPLDRGDSSGSEPH